MGGPEKHGERNISEKLVDDLAELKEFYLQHWNWMAQTAISSGDRSEDVNTWIIGLQTRIRAIRQSIHNELEITEQSEQDSLIHQKTGIDPHDVFHDQYRP